ncbi:SDR family oxidoreductase [Guptibacillus hwajinpoensis]|uniref:SDR family oxidoreductase n=1 Tax=Guptibacillus hwajinpoensis TaxID=208199 RepID=UPI003D0318EC
MNNQRNRIAIVTGVSRPNGIGASICRELARKGHDIFFTHLSKYDVSTGYKDATETFPVIFKKELQEMGVIAEEMELDLNDPHAPEYLIAQAKKMTGELAILVNNATHCVEVDHDELSAEILDQHCAVNVRGTCMLSVTFAKQLKKEQVVGRIINFVSGQDKSPQPGNLAYITTKGAISAFTTSLATELAPYNITVNAIDPGPTDSGWMDDEIQTFLKPKFPTGRIGTPDDAARLVGFLGSHEARWITGQIIHSDGGVRDERV